MGDNGSSGKSTVTGISEGAIETAKNVLAVVGLAATGFAVYKLVSKYAVPALSSGTGKDQTADKPHVDIGGTARKRTGSNVGRGRRASSSQVGRPHSGSEVGRSTPSGRKGRVYIDGCFDMMHYGHSNALRQARAVGDELVVGLVGDADIVKNKGSAPVMSFKERLEALRACKWVDKVIPDAPYDLTQEWVDYLVREHGIEYVVHGDDPCITADGKDAYAYAKSLGRFRMIKRTEGVSTTDIVGRMLLMTTEHHLRTPHHAGSGAMGGEEGGSAPGSPVLPALGVGAGRSGSIVSLGDKDDEEDDGGDFEGATGLGPGHLTPVFAGVEAEPGPVHDGGLAIEASAGGGAGTGAGMEPPSPVRSRSVSSQMRRIAAMQGPVRFLPTSRRFTQFSTGKAPGPGDRVVYVPGGWDLFNTGHIETLRRCKKLGDFVLVGVYDDQTVNRLRGGGWPVLNQYERTMSVLACRYADEVVMNAPFHVTRDLLLNFNVQIVVQPSRSDLLPPGDGGYMDEEDDEEEGGVDEEKTTGEEQVKPTEGHGRASHAAEGAGEDSGGARVISSSESIASATLSRREQVRRAIQDSLTLPREEKKLRRIALGSDLVFGDDIVRRVRQRQAEMSARYRQKSKKEAEYNRAKEHVPEG